MLTEELVRNRNKFFIPPVITRFIPSNEQDCASPWVKGVEHAVGTPSVLNNKLFHVRTL